VATERNERGEGCCLHDVAESERKMWLFSLTLPSMKSMYSVYEEKCLNRDIRAQSELEEYSILF